MNKGGTPEGGQLAAKAALADWKSPVPVVTSPTMLPMGTPKQLPPQRLLCEDSPTLRRLLSMSDAETMKMSRAEFDAMVEKGRSECPVVTPRERSR